MLHFCKLNIEKPGQQEMQGNNYSSNWSWYAPDFDVFEGTYLEEKSVLLIYSVYRLLMFDHNNYEDHISSRKCNVFGYAEPDSCL